MNDDQLSLFDAARVGRDDGLARVERGAGPVWSTYAFDFLVRYLQTHPTFFADDLWTAGLERPREMRALGPVVLKAVRAGYIVWTGELRPGVRSHLQRRPVYRSTIYYRNEAAS